MNFLLVVFIIMISIGLFSPAVIPVSSVELVIDDMNEITDWTSSGGASPPKLSSTDNQKTHSFYLKKLDIKSDWARYTKKLKTGQNYSNYEKVSYSVYIPDSEVIKQISIWFGEKERWDAGFIHYQTQIKNGWNHITHNMFMFTPVGARLKTWEKIKFISFEITTYLPTQTFEGILIRDLRLINQKDTIFQLKTSSFAIWNDQPFFPIGFYSVSSDIKEDEWVELSQSGFNLITCAESHYFNQLVCENGDTSKWIEFLDQAHRHGLKVAVQLSTGQWIPTAHVWWALDLNPDEVVYQNLRRIGRSQEDARYCADRDRNIAYLHTIVDALKDHPALFCWESLDEISQYKIPVEGLLEGISLLKRLDPKHDIWLNHPPSVIDPRWLHHYGHAVDIVSLDIYPVPKAFGYGNLPNKEINNVGQYTDLLHRSLTNCQSVWMVLQAYRFNDDEFSHLPQKDLRRFPTYPEIRFMTYQSITHGTKGIMYFLYLRQPTLSTAHTHVNTPFTPEFWNTMKSVGRELKTLYLALIAETSHRLKIGSDHISCLLKHTDNQTWLIAVNEQNEPSQTTFEFDQPIKKLDVMFEDRSVIFDSNLFTDKFAGYDVHVYHLELVQSSNDVR
ncbi:TPA: hypothetical protein EYN65_20320 [Candidatus Poribacteria bacterium]|nr:hypothetical protein [Candidatus Poribacteria bacterium]